MFYTIHFATSLYLDILRGEYGNLVIYFNYGEAIRLVNDRISCLKHELPNTTIAATLIAKEFKVVGLDSLALFFVKKSLINIVKNLNANPEAVLVYSKGLQQIVKIKGGLD
jgi:hypothetical protein